MKGRPHGDMVQRLEEHRWLSSLWSVLVKDHGRDNSNTTYAHSCLRKSFFFYKFLVIKPRMFINLCFCCCKNSFFRENHNVMEYKQ